MAKIAYGIDFAGFTTNKIAIAKAEYDEITKHLTLTLYNNHPFYVKNSSLDTIKNEGALLISSMLQKEKVYVDVPIDLQKLATHLTDDINVQKDWELHKRPIDRLFEALSPLGDRIGITVMGFRYLLLKSLKDETIEELLGENLFETYPKISLQNLVRSTMEDHGDYKEQSIFFSQTKNEFNTLDANDIDYDYSKEEFNQLNENRKKNRLGKLMKIKAMSKEINIKESRSLEITRSIRDMILNNEIDKKKDKNIQRKAKDIAKLVIDKNKEYLKDSIKKKKSENLKEIFNELFKNKTINFSHKFSLNDDECDAIICALTGVLPRLEEEELHSFIKKRYKNYKDDFGDMSLDQLIPQGYCILDSTALSQVNEITINKIKLKVDIKQNKIIEVDKQVNPLF